MKIARRHSAEVRILRVLQGIIGREYSLSPLFKPEGIGKFIKKGGNMPVKRCQRCYRQDNVSERVFALQLQPNFSVRFTGILCKGCAYEIGKGLDYLNFIFENQMNVEVIGEIQTQFAAAESPREAFDRGNDASSGIGKQNNADPKRRRGGEKVKDGI